MERKIKEEYRHEDAERDSLNKMIDTLLLSRLTKLEEKNRDKDGKEIYEEISNELKKLHELKFALPPKEGKRTFAEIEGLTPPIKGEDETNEEAIHYRNLALHYSSALYRPFDKANEMFIWGGNVKSVLGKIAERLEKEKIWEKSNPEKIEYLEREKRKIEILSDALEKYENEKNEILANIEKKKESYRKIYEDILTEDTKKMFSYLEPAEGESPALIKIRQKLAEKMQENFFHSTYQEVSYKSTLSKKEKEMVKEIAGKGKGLYGAFMSRWMEKYKPLAFYFEKRNERYAIETVKKMFFVEISLQKAFKDISISDIERLKQEAKEEKKQRIEEIEREKEDIEERLSDGDLTNFQRRQLLKELNVLERMIGAEKILSLDDSRKIEEIKEFIQKDKEFGLNLSALNIENGEDIINLLNTIKKVEEDGILNENLIPPTEKNRLDKLKSFANISSKGIDFAFRNDTEIIKNATKLFNMNVLIEKVMHNKVSEKTLLENRERIISYGIDKKFLDGVLESAKIRDKRATEMRKPLKLNEYLQMLHDIRTRDFAKDLHKKTDKISLLLNTKEVKENEFLKKIILTAQLFKTGISGENARFSSCLQKIAFPPDTGLNERPSKRLLDCIGKYERSLAEEERKWDGRLQKLLTPSPFNPFIFPYFILSAYMGTLNSLKETSLKAMYLKYEIDLKEEAEEKLKNLTKKEADVVMKNLIRQKLGVAINIKSERGYLTRLEEEGIGNMSKTLQETFDDILKRTRKGFGGDVKKDDYFTNIDNFFKDVEERIIPEIENVENNVALSKLIRKRKDEIKKIKEGEGGIIEKINYVKKNSHIPEDEKEKINLSIEAEKRKILSVINNTISLINSELEPHKDLVCSTVKVGDKYVVFQFSKDKLTEMGLENRLGEITQESDVIRRKELFGDLLSEVGVNLNELKYLIDKGEIKNGMEYNRVFGNVFATADFRELYKDREIVDLMFSDFEDNEESSRKIKRDYTEQEDYIEQEKNVDKDIDKETGNNEAKRIER